MTPDEIRKAGLRLAKLVNDRPPSLRCKQDLADYADHVDLILFLDRMDKWTEDDAEVASVRYQVDPRDTIQRRHDARRCFEHRRDLHKMGAAARKKQGVKTQERVRTAYANLQGTDRSKSEFAEIIDKRLGLSARQVRRHLKSLK
jgi:hypothetical protein